jgi:hypothetical protein
LGADLLKLEELAVLEKKYADDAEGEEGAPGKKGAKKPGLEEAEGAEEEVRVR